MTSRTTNCFASKIIICAVLILVLVSPTQVFASVIFSEIMYDLEEGSDGGREWIEIFNPDSSAVSLSGWKFYENKKNHGLSIELGDESLESGEYAVIADNPTKFLLDWPQFSGTLFDSSFSLSNSGETLTIRDSELVDIDLVTYSSEQGGSGDGNSLYFTGSLWSFGTPTPGTGDLTTEQTQEESQTEESTTGPSSSSASSFPVEQQIFAFAGDDRIVTVGASSEFNGRAAGLIGEELSDARFMWNFGDGSRVEGKSILYHYRYPGKYVVVLEVSSGEYSASDRMYVSASEAQVSVTDASGDMITLRNDSNREINLSWWILESNNQKFDIPEHTIILPESSLIFSSEVTGLHPYSKDGVNLKYPNGSLVLALSSVDEEESPEVTYAPQASSNDKSIIGRPVSSFSIQQSVISNEKVEVEDKVVSTSQLTASVGDISGENEEEDNPLYKWLFALIVVVVGASSSALFLRKQSRDEITIID